MIRILYRVLLWLHPPAFRREFANEMLWIFDETRGAAATAMLFSDALVSLARQWLLRSGAWKLAAAGLGGLAQVTIGGFVFVFVRQLGHAGHRIPETVATRPEMMRLIYMTAGVAAGVISSVIALALWARNFTGRRMHHDA
jgi:hypothetical protein